MRRISRTAESGLGRRPFAFADTVEEFAKICSMAPTASGSLSCRAFICGRVEGIAAAGEAMADKRDKKVVKRAKDVSMLGKLSRR